MEKLFVELSKGIFEENYQLKLPNQRVMNIRKLCVPSKIAMLRFEDAFTGTSALGTT